MESMENCFIPTFDQIQFEFNLKRIEAEPRLFANRLAGLSGEDPPESLEDILWLIWVPPGRRIEHLEGEHYRAYLRDVEQAALDLLCLTAGLLSDSRTCGDLDPGLIRERMPELRKRIEKFLFFYYKERALGELRKRSRGGSALRRPAVARKEKVKGLARTWTAS
jgi:hypothetical protein